MVCFLTGYASCAASASLPAWPAHRKARSAPRAHVRELLCVSQSSKERLRRSRTESSGAAPAIEELAGEARQVRPAGPRADQSQPGSDFSRAKRSGGRPALQLPRASNPRGSLNIHLRPDRVPQKSEFPALVLPSPIRRGLEGARPSSTREHQILAEVQISIFAPTASRSNRKLLIGPCSSLAKRSGGRQALQHPRASNPCGSSISRLPPAFCFCSGSLEICNQPSKCYSKA